MKELVTGKLDYYSAMFYDRSFSDVLRWLRVDIDEFRDQFQEEQRSQFFGMENWRFEYDNIVLYAQNCGYYGIDDDRFFDRVVPRIKLDLKGKGLDSLRARWESDRDNLKVSPASYITVDDFLRDDFRLLDEKQKVTRVDYAIDLVNYAPDFLDKVLWHIDDFAHENGTVACVGGRGHRYQYRTFGGTSKGCYIGSNTSNRFLRIYDKKIEQTDRRTGLYKIGNPYNNPDSWIRIELQCKNDEAGRLLFSLGDHKSIFKWITETYGLADVTKPHPYPLVDFWAKLMDWSKIERLYTEYSFCSTHKNLTSQVVEQFEARLPRSIVAMLILQQNGVDLNEYFKSAVEFMSTPNNDAHLEVIRRKRYNRFLDVMAQCGIGSVELATDNYILGYESRQLVWRGFDKMKDGQKGTVKNE